VAISHGRNTQIVESNMNNTAQVNYHEKF